MGLYDTTQGERRCSKDKAERTDLGTPALKGGGGQKRMREFEFISGKLGDPADHKQNLTWSNEKSHGDL